MSEKLVTIAEFESPTAAHMARIRLEEEEIECFITDENTNVFFVLPFPGGEFSVKLQVRESDVDKALQIIKDSPSKQDPADSR